jgi:hypothetical protein
VKPSGFRFSRVAFAIVFLIGSGCAWQSELTDRGDLEQAFAEEYHFTPPASVTDMRCKIVNIGDSWSKWMSFTCERATFDRIVADGFAHATGSETTRGGMWSAALTDKGPNVPAWWRNPTDPERIVAYFKTAHPNDLSGCMTVWWDEASNTVFCKSAAWH